MNKRAVSLVLAVVLAGFATVALVDYVRGLERKALGRGETKSVFVARESIPEGTTANQAIERQLVGKITVPRTAIVGGVITSLDEIRGKIASAQIHKGEQIVGGRFVSQSRPRALLPIPPGLQAMAVEVPTPPGVAGFVQPGDHVSIIAKAESQAGGEATVKFLVQDVEVLAVGRRVAGARQAQSQPTTQPPGLNAGQAKVLVTLALKAAEAEQVAYAVFQGDIYFTLLPRDAKPQITSGRAANNLFS